MPKAKILFIEDDPDQIYLYKTKFRLEGYNLISAVNGVKGIKAAVTKKPDLILLDILLTDENGLDVLKKIKENSETKKIPVIVFTNFDNDKTIQQALALGAQDYVIKSKIVPTDIVEKVQTILRN